MGNGWISHLRERWRRNVGDPRAERMIRAELDERGFGGSMALILDTRLAAVERPGWVQVSRFEARAKHLATGDRRTFYGVTRDDERSNDTRIGLFEIEAEREAQFLEWSDGLLRMGSHSADRAAPARKALLALFLVLLVLAIAGSVLS